MKTKLITALVILVVAGLFAKVAQKIYKDRQERIRIANLKDTASPNVQVFTDFDSIKTLERNLTIRVYLPPNHAKDSIRYPVMYFLDGENLFSEKVSGGTEWQVDEVLDSMIATGGQASIVVGIDSPLEGRNEEYKPFNPKTEAASKGTQLLDYISQELKPQIDSLYQTLPAPEHTTIGGCSLGGIMSLYGITHYQETFGNGFLFSPSLWVSERFYTFPKRIKNWDKTKVYINVGDSEGFMDDDALKLHQAFLDAGLPKAQLGMSIEKGLGHYHKTWQVGFAKAYPWLVE